MKHRHQDLAQVEVVVHLQHNSTLARVVDLCLFLFVVRQGSVGFLPKGSEVDLQYGQEPCCIRTKLGVIVTPYLSKQLPVFSSIVAVAMMVA